jgi:hypothetical protein
LDYFFVSNILQENVDKTTILTALKSDHSPIFLSIKDASENEKGPSYWKFNATLRFDSEYEALFRESFASWHAEYAGYAKQLRWDLEKYEIRKMTTKFSKNKAKARRETVKRLENIINDFESSSAQNAITTEIYTDAKRDFEQIKNDEAVGTILRAKCSWYEDGEKSTKYFASLEKNNAIQSSIRAIFDENAVELTQKQPILDRVGRFYSSLFSKKITNARDINMNFLSSLDLPTLSEEQKAFCDIEFTKDDLYETLTTMQGGKSPGNDGLTKEFYIHFWDLVGDSVFESFIEAKTAGTLSPSQRQALIKLIAKKDRDKRYIENWRPISLLNVDTKILSKTIASKLKTVLPSLVKSDQTAYVPGRFIGESCRLISDVIEIADKLNIEGWLVTMDIQKAFDSVDHDFLFCVLENAGFGEPFINWVKLLVKNQMSCVTNGGTTTTYFDLLRGCRQGDPISAYLFIMVIEVFFHMVRTNRLIEGLKILNFEHKLTAYADDSTFFLRNEASVNELIKTFELFSKYSGLLLNKSKCELAGIGAKKDVFGESVTGLKKVRLSDDSVQILGIHYTYDQRLLLEKNFATCIKKITSNIAMWKWRCLTLAGKVTVFKTLGISRAVYIAYLTVVPPQIYTQLDQIQKDFLWDGKRPKVAQKALISAYEDGGLKSVDITAKIKALRLSWVSRLYTGSDHPWKYIPAKLLRDHLSHNPFFPNMAYSPPPLLPDFYKEIVLNWTEVAETDPVTPSSIQNQLLWNNTKIRIGNHPIKKCLNIDFVGDLIGADGAFLSWSTFSSSPANRPSMTPFKYMQIIDAIPTSWKNIIRNNLNDFLENNGTLRDQHLLSLTRFIGLERLTSKLIYIHILSKIKAKPTSESTINRKFSNLVLNWPKIYMVARYSTIDSYTRIFHFKCTHNILYLNTQLHNMGLAENRLCTYCEEQDETINHLFYECPKTLDLWAQIQQRFPGIELPDITPVSAYIGLPFDSIPLIQHLHLIFRICLYKGREKKVCNIQYFVNKTKQTRQIETQITSSNPRKRLFNQRKWAGIHGLL